MKVIGLIGGMSWESTAEYYRLINEKERTRLEGLHSAAYILHSVDFDEIERYQAESEWEKAGIELPNVAVSLERKEKPPISFRLWAARNFKCGNF